MNVENKNRAASFWKSLDEGLCTSLERRAEGDYRGEVMIPDGGRGDPFENTKPFAISGRELLEYDYDEDERFSGAFARSLSEALLTVLQRRGFNGKSATDFHRLSLVVRLLRDPDPDLPPGIVVETNILLDEFADREMTGDELVARLKALVPGRDETFEVLCSTVLDFADRKIIPAAKAGALLHSGGTPGAVPFNVARKLVLDTLAGCKVPIAKACRFLELLLPTAGDYAAMQEGGMIAAVRTERDILLQALAICPNDQRITAQIFRILDNHRNEDLFLVIEAIRALGMHNGKEAIDFLVERLARPDMVRYRDDIEEALQRLCSGNLLIPGSAFGIDFEALSESELAEFDKEEDELRIEHDYWTKVAKKLPRNRLEWFQHDGASVYWEKRLRCAAQAGDLKVPDEMIAPLRRDEVKPVRLAAGGPD